VTDSITDWLRAQLDEDERIARWAVSEHEREPRLVKCETGGQWSRRYVDYGGTEVVDGAGHVIVPAAHDKGAAVRTHIAAHDPARVLREIDAKRQIIEQHERYAAERRRMMGGWDPRSDDSPVLAALASVYADRPGYRDGRRP